MATSLHETLKEIAQIEEENKFLGARITTKGSESTTKTDQVAVFVRDSLLEMVEFSRKLDHIPVSEAEPPDDSSRRNLLRN